MLFFKNSFLKIHFCNFDLKSHFFCQQNCITKPPLITAKERVWLKLNVNGTQVKWRGLEKVFRSGNWVR
jgi:hypothetical protein